MATVDSRVARWVDVVSALLDEPLTVFPHATIAMELAGTFELVASSWNWRDSATAFGFDLYPDLAGSIPDSCWESWRSAEILDRHALVRWFATTGDPRPQTVSRVPTSVSSARNRAFVDQVLYPIGCEEQLSIPYLMDGFAHRAFVLARARDDFTDDDIAVAHRLQPLLRALHRQVQVLGSDRPWTGQSVAIRAIRATELSGRELAVLRLLADGHTAVGIAQRLTTSPRTVQKHLQHVYRKLEVSDRLAAVRVAWELGLVVPHAVPSGHESAGDAAGA